MRHLRLAAGVTAFCATLSVGSAPAHADIVDIIIANPNIAVMRPAREAQPVAFFFEVSVHNNSSYDLDFEYALDDNTFTQIGGIGIPPLYLGPNPAETALVFTDSTGVRTKAPALMSLQSCGDGISLLCLHPNETFVGNIAYGLIEPTTATGLYAVTQDGAGYPATMTFQGTYVLNGETMSFTQESPPYSVNVVAQNAVPEANPWVLLMAGLASVLLISSRRIRG